MAYIISDTHFFHDNILKYNRPQFKNVKEMNENLIEQWNSIISKNDRVFHLGDFAFGQDLNAIEQIINRLNGSIYLIIGNHDTPAKIELYQRYFKLFSIYKDGNIVFTHCPLHPTLLEEISPRSEGTNERFNVHGHNHRGCIPDKRYFNACWDIEHKIYTLEEVRKKFIKEDLICK